MCLIELDFWFEVRCRVYFICNFVKNQTDKNLINQNETIFHFFDFDDCGAGLDGSGV